MAAYVILKIAIINQEKLSAYQQIAPSIIKQYGGKLLARGGQLMSLEGEEEKRRIVIIEFASMEQAQSFYFSCEYQEAITLRQGAAEFDVLLVEGLSS